MGTLSYHWLFGIFKFYQLGETLGTRRNKKIQPVLLWSTSSKTECWSLMTSARVKRIFIANYLMKFTSKATGKQFIFTNVMTFRESIRSYHSNRPRKASAIFGYPRKSLEISGKCSETFAWPSDKFWKIFANLPKIVKLKMSILVCLFRKQSNTQLLVEMECLFLCSSLYRVEHSKRNSISTPAHELFFI